jgi:hypothetical protein
MTAILRNSFELESHHPTSAQNEQNYATECEVEENAVNQESNNSQALEPADGGASAWKMLLGAFVFEAVLWGRFNQEISSAFLTYIYRLSIVIWCFSELLFSTSRILK